jgi:hypothetical protein
MVTCRWNVEGERRRISWNYNITHRMRKKIKEGDGKRAFRPVQALTCVICEGKSVKGAKLSSKRSHTLLEAKRNNKNELMSKNREGYND